MGHVVEPGFSNHWRLYNGNVVMGSWAIREVIFYSDRDCTQPLPRTERVDHYFDHHKGLPDVSSSQQEHLAISAMDESETTYWQVSDEASASCEEAECHWYGFKFFAAVTVQCVELHQGDSPNTEQALYKMNPIRLKYLDSQGEWAQAAQWDTPDADYPMLQVHDPHVPRSASNRRRLRYVQEAQPPPSRDPQPQHCFDGVQNTGEIDVDCGGPCDDCAALEIDELLVSSGAINGVAWAGGTQLAIGTGDETFEIRKFMGKLHDYEPVTKQTSDGPVVAVAFASTEETAASLAVQNGGHSVLDLYAPQKVGVPDSDVDNCSPDPCQNGGICTGVANSYICTCPAGYTGDNCQTAVDCAIGEWEAWGSCSASCGDGTRTRSRMNTELQHAACPTGNTESEACNEDPCDQDCMFTWASWGACSQSCAGGTRSRTASISTPAAGSGTACPSSPDTEACNPQPCDDDDCTPNPCQNGGACIDGINSYTCTCATGYIGTNCETGIYGVQMEVELPFAKVQSHFHVLDILPLFDNTQQLKYRLAVAAAAGVSISMVTIQSITAFEHGIIVNTMVHVPVIPPNLDISNLNQQLNSQGLPHAVMFSPPKVILLEALHGAMDYTTCEATEWSAWPLDEFCSTDNFGEGTRIRYCHHQCATLGGRDYFFRQYQEIPCAWIDDPDNEGCEKIEATVCDAWCYTGRKTVLTFRRSKHPHGAQTCHNDETAIGDCEPQHDCSQTCVMGPWAEWGKCLKPGTAEDAVCEKDQGVQTRQRSVQRPALNNKPCPSSNIERPCNRVPCEADCIFDDWTKSSECSAKCNGGTEEWSRRLIQPAVGRECIDDAEFKVTTCNTQACPCWVRFPNMRFIDWESTTEWGKSLTFCKDHCDNDESCKLFSYHKIHHYCQFSSKSLSDAGAALTHLTIFTGQAGVLEYFTGAAVWDVYEKGQSWDYGAPAKAAFLQVQDVALTLEPSLAVNDAKSVEDCAAHCLSHEAAENRALNAAAVKFCKSFQWDGTTCTLFAYNIADDVDNRHMYRQPGTAHFERCQSSMQVADRVHYIRNADVNLQ